MREGAPDPQPNISQAGQNAAATPRYDSLSISAIALSELFFSTPVKLE
jgi:hypothetical protein